MSYKVYFEQLPNGATPIYNSNGGVTYLIDLDENILQIDHKKSGPRVSGHSLEIHGDIGPLEVLVKLLEIFEALNQVREGSPHTILCAHKGFTIIRSGRPNECVYSIGSIAIFSFEGDVGDNHGFSETLSVPINYDFSPTTFNYEQTYINFNSIDNRNDLERQFEIAQVMYA